jgi:hypothetical protein
MVSTHYLALEIDMADWSGTSRSNYFRIKDEAAFRKWAEALELAVITDAEGRFGFYSEAEDGGLPSARVGEDIDLVAELATHLVEGSIAILMETGHEKARYMSGYAIALNSEGQQVALILSDIYTKAAEFFHTDLKNISEASY